MSLFELPSIKLNAGQSEAVERILAGMNFSLIGGAGTGKTTCTQYGIVSLINSGQLSQESLSHKYIPPHSFGFVVTSLTKIAVANLRKRLPPELQGNCINIHKLLEFVPVEVPGEGGKTVRIFKPARNKYNPLPKSLKYFFFEEMSMLDKNNLWAALIEAIHPESDPVFIGLGDLNQLPPPFGESIFPYFMCNNPITKLTEVYRQALDSKIINLAYQILDGTPKEIPTIQTGLETSSQGNVTIRAWPKVFTPPAALGAVKTLLFGGEKNPDSGAYQQGKYDPFEDMILMPFNKSFGTIDMNKHIASFLASKFATDQDPVYEVIAGYNQHYFRVGDRVLADKEEAYVIDIQENPSYSGKLYAQASRTLNYFGYDPEAKELSEEEFDDWLMKHKEDAEDRVNQASHIIKVRKTSSEQEVSLRTAAEINALLLGYALTIHKAQGSEWRRVFCIFHKEHNKMLCRELLYTGVTRAREELIIIGPPDLFEKGIYQQKIRGDTIEEKLTWFKDNLLNNGKSLDIFGEE